jgi:hypothetical protein
LGGLGLIFLSLAAFRYVCLYGIRSLLNAMIFATRNRSIEASLESVSELAYRLGSPILLPLMLLCKEGYVPRILPMFSWVFRIRFKLNEALDSDDITAGNIGSGACGLTAF